MTHTHRCIILALPLALAACAAGAAERLPEPAAEPEPASTENMPSPPAEREPPPDSAAPAPQASPDSFPLDSLATSLPAAMERAEPGAGRVAAVIDSAMTAGPLRRAHWGVLVVDEDGDTVVSINADRLFVTASNLKVVQTAATLDLLGPEYRFRTLIEAPGGAAAGLPDGVARALVVRGSGDPTFSEFFHEPPDRPLAPLDSLADSLRAAGLRRVDGPVLIDQSRFDSVLVHPAWEHGDLDWYYGAPVAPFAVMESTIPVVITPLLPGQLAAVRTLAPDGLFAVDAAVRTAADSGRWNDALRRVPGTDSLILRGFIGPDVGPDTSWIAQDDPGRVAGRALVMALERAGIDVAGSVRVTYDRAEADSVAAGAGLYAAWESPPLLDMIWLPLERSDNWLTEQLLRAVAADQVGRGSWSAGADRVEQWLVERVGADSTAMYFRDGSGLSAQNLLTPEAMVTLLRWVQQQPWGPAFRDAMAAPGVPDGTLEDRLEGFGSRVAAKTGTIRHVNALSGYLRTMSGRELVFCIMTNGSGQPARKMRDAIDRVVESLITSGD